MENKEKLIGILSYITFVGWVIAFVLRNNNSLQTRFMQFHLRQGLGISIIGTLSSWLIGPFLSNIGLPLMAYGLWICITVLRIVGIINAVQDKINPLPFLGEWFDEKLDFI